MTPVTSLGIPTNIKRMRMKGVNCEQIISNLPNLGVSLKTEPVRQRTVLLLGLAELNLGDE